MPTIKCLSLSGENSRQLGGKSSIVWVFDLIGVVWLASVSSRLDIGQTDFG